MIRRSVVTAALALAPFVCIVPSAVAKTAGCVTNAMLEKGFTREEAEAGVTPQRFIDGCKLLRKACRTFVAAQNDPVLETRVEKHTTALTRFREAGYEQSETSGSEAAIGALCKASFPKAKKIQKHDFTVWVPLASDPDGSPPELD